MVVCFFVQKPHIVLYDRQNFPGDCPPPLSETYAPTAAPKVEVPLNRPWLYGKYRPNAVIKAVLNGQIALNMHIAYVCFSCMNRPTPLVFSGSSFRDIVILSLFSCKVNKGNKTIHVRVTASLLCE